MDTSLEQPTGYVVIKQRFMAPKTNAPDMSRMTSFEVVIMPRYADSPALREEDVNMGYAETYEQALVIVREWVDAELIRARYQSALVPA